MTELAIIADDLSGALDSAAPFAARGHHTIVALSPAALGKVNDTGASVVAVSTDSRDVAPAEARERTAAAWLAFPEGTKAFKKIDSRLKGNLVTELDALTFSKALVVPAIPAFGRWVRDGKLGGFGVDAPIDVAGRLGHHAARAIIPDAATQDDIHAALQRGGYDLLVGARALAEAQAERMGIGGRGAGKVVHRGPVLVVIGSTDPITLEQVDHLRRAFPDIAYFPAPNGVVPDGARLSDAITVIQATPGSQRADAGTVSENLARAVATLDPPDNALLVVSGGATAQAVLDFIGIDLLEVLGEVVPGLPLADAGRFKLITKSGGFGGPDAFVDVLNLQGAGTMVGGA
ncbi:four-carbon acid sugar kinase family protein [Pelagibacterium sp. H642]|uniref:four-carbon acid sugar kinase family protein n=1 Tax=Pelagibacterium sp. H642 TaxID=1881069 RepID=UPI002816042C|nr:four-carbon acid sugar kinase family protein [Pelagibacterium sp. H642]WMT90393.1 four-carbon acid sugar kinase family protein [Pelagibacterium sp. H642]